MSLATGERHGYAIIQDVAARTDGELQLSAATLYRSIHRMLELGLIAEPRRRPMTGDDTRRRYYRIRPLGMKAAQAEAARLQRLVRLARSSGFATGRA